MTFNKRKKNSRQMGSKTHGWGAMKKHRGAGNRGGRGMAGSGKRADSKKPSLWKERYFGKKGFKKKGRRTMDRCVNLSYIEGNLDSLISKKLVSKKDELYIVDCDKLGFTKLLGDGRVTKKFKITVDSASKKAVERVKTAGGDVIFKGGNSKKEGVN